MRQRTRGDCGVAALATRCGVGYEDALRAMGLDEPPFGTTFRDMSSALAALTGARWLVVRCRRWEDVPLRVIVSVRLGNQRGYHWLVRGPAGGLLDPACGPWERPEDTLYRPCHYLVPGPERAT